MVEGKTIFITGGAGFIASHLIDRLIDTNKVMVYDNLHRNALALTDLQHHPNLKLIRGDVLDREFLCQAMQGADICVHAAAIAGIYSVGEQVSHTMKVNLLGVYHALEAAVTNQISRFIDLSTSEVYGPFVYKGHESGRTTLGPVGEKRWVYAVSKLAGEHLAHAYATDYGIDVVTIRPFNVYGPRQVGEGAIQQMVRKALLDQPLTIYNDGTQIRSWCYVSDFVGGLLGTLSLDEAKNRTFNLGNPRATVTVLGLAQTIIKVTNSRSEITFKPHPGPEVELRIPDISRAIEYLDFQPTVDLEEGLRRTIAWYSKNG